MVHQPLYDVAYQRAEGGTRPSTEEDCEVASFESHPQKGPSHALPIETLCGRMVLQDQSCVHSFVVRNQRHQLAQHQAHRGDREHAVNQDVLPVTPFAGQHRAEGVEGHRAKLRHEMHQQEHPPSRLYHLDLEGEPVVRSTSRESQQRARERVTVPLEEQGRGSVGPTTHEIQKKDGGR